MIKKILLITFLIIFNSKVYAEFEKEVKLTDEGKCEEALAENEKTNIEQEEKFNPKKPFVGKHTIKIFRVYSLNRKIQILDKNCNKKKEAFELAKKSLKLEKELFKIPLKEINKVLKYNDFQRKINLAGAYTRVGGFYSNYNNLNNAIKLFEDAVKILESTDLYDKNNLLNYNYSILSNFYIKIGNFKQAEKFKNKNLNYMKNRYGEGTIEYANAFISLYFLFSDQGHYDYALQTLLDIQKNVDVNLLYKNSEGDHNMSQIEFTHLLGTAYYKINDYDNAIESHYKVLNYIKSQKSLIKEKKK